MSFSDCCKAKMKNGFCTKCGNPAAEMTVCYECLGEGRIGIIDYNRVHGRTITLPYKTAICELCKGEGYLYADLEEPEDLEESEEE